MMIEHFTDANEATMNDHQRRLWTSMVSMLEDFKAGRIEFARMVGNLEGTLDAGEYHDKSLTDQWYARWTDLETVNALEGNNVRYEDVAESVDAMLQFLRENAAAAPQ
jgi:hypothetical protein